MLDPGEQVAHAVDINPRKQGMFVTGTGQEIVAPEDLMDIQPDVVMVMNPIYIDEIRMMVGALGIDAEFVTV